MKENKYIICVTTLIILSILISIQTAYGQIEEFKKECECTPSLICYYADDKYKISPYRVDTKIPSLRIPIPEDIGGALPLPKDAESHSHFTVRVWQPIEDMSKPNYNILIVNNWVDNPGKDVIVKNGGGKINEVTKDFLYPSYGVRKTVQDGKYKTAIFVFISRGDEYEDYDVIEAEVILYKTSEEGGGEGEDGCTMCHSNVERIQIPRDGIVRGPSFDIVGIMILSICLVIISISRLRIKRK